MVSNTVLSAISGPTYVTAQALIQQVAYILSDKIFSYSPESFDLDSAVRDWATGSEINANGDVTSVQRLQTRHGAGAIALGYIFSRDFDLKKRHIPQGILASSATLPYLRPALEQLSLLYSVASPVVAHVAAVDYVDGRLVTDYASALALAEELGFGLVCSRSAHEVQHMGILATLLASFMPVVHIYDGVRVGRETTRIIDALDKSGLSHTYNVVRQRLTDARTKHMDAEGKALSVLESLNAELGTEYGLFEYHGHPEAVAILVAFGTVEASLTAQVAHSLAKVGSKVGVVNVRIYRPFVEEEFLRMLPKSAKTIGILGQVKDELAVQEEGVHSALYDDVLAALTFAGDRTKTPQCIEIKYARSYQWTLLNIAAAFQRVAEKPILQVAQDAQDPAPLQLLDPATVQEYTFWDVDNSATCEAAVMLARALATDSAWNVNTNAIYNNLIQGGVVRVDIRRSNKTMEAPYAVDAADVSYVGDIKLLGDIDVLASVKENGKIIISAPGLKDDELEKKLPPAFRQALAQRGISLFIVDPLAFKESPLELPILHAAFLQVAFPSPNAAEWNKLLTVAGIRYALGDVTKELVKILREIEVPASWSNIDGTTQGGQIQDGVSANSFLPFDKKETEPPSLLQDWKTLAKGLAFKEAYATKTALRPDVNTKTFTVRVKENRRLTPITYDRNIFHIEFDLGNSGLTYDIGEALGVHAENDPVDVMEFIKSYGLNPDQVVELPNRDDPSILESRTVYQFLVQNVDLFGRPPKRFYEALSEFATEEKEKKELLTLGGPEGAAEFKRRAEVDTVTFADILSEFPSAHPSFHDIVRIVNPMKRREYSIASCQKVTSTSVALMIVVVHWIDPRGRDRFGQATQYLSRLQPGTPVTVSVKPSVMKLPPRSTQPLIMAGLGTGLAPFRAFVQHRALEKSQGKEIGSVLLYMGSRHQREEYCYGEEWEAYQEAGVITVLGRAFSRDQPQKIYIQDRMRQTLSEIIQAYIREEGAFYLCGPTWPVADVTSVLEEAIAAEAQSQGKKVEPRKEIEKLKEVERYVLEVY
ncbi:hypothetical protein V8E54_005503 [Elaphomyces granulatus]